MVNVHTLVCHRDVDLSVQCLRSLEEFCSDPVKLVLHDDGSLTDEDQEKLCGALREPVIFSRDEADAKMAEHLHGYPAASAFRTRSVWGLKMLDIVFLEDGVCFYCDGDIKFFRSFRGLFAEEVCRDKSVFLADTVWEAYSVRPWHLMDRRKLKVMSGINTGLTIIAKNLYDMDYVEWFLSQPDYRCIPAWTEPTCWAGLAARANGHVVSPFQMVNLYPGAKIVEETFGGHLLSSYRKHWNGILNARLELDSRQSITAKLLKCRSCTPAMLFQNQLKRKVANTIRLYLGV